jgi:RNA polymerase sigma factor (sigma-70 family)
MDAVIRHLRRAASRQDGAAWSDGQLLTSFLDHQDEAAFAALVRRHGPMVFGVCRRVVRNHHDAEDAFQATLLVLARRASSVRPRERLASWLHGVALRVALKAKAAAARRSGREKQVAEFPDPEAPRHDSWRDLRPLLDQQLNGLPENYRLPILLCDLQGKSIQEATRQLGWPQGTLAGRLSRGRKLLAKRLTSRGVVLSAGSLAAVVSQGAASASVPAALVSSTVRSAALIAAGRASVAGVVPARVAVLTEGVVKAMSLSKFKTAAAELVLAALLCGAVGAADPTRAAEQPKGGQGDKAPAGAAASPEIFPSPPKIADQYEYVLVSKQMEAGADEAGSLLPKMTVLEGQPCRLAIAENPQNLLAKVVADEKIRIGSFYDVRVTRLGDDKVRLILAFERDELDKSSVDEIHVIGHSVQAIRDVELHKPAKVVFQKNAAGSPQRWLEITVDAVKIPATTAAPPPRP